MHRRLGVYLAALALLSLAAAPIRAQEVAPTTQMVPPRVTSAAVDWTPALKELSALPSFETLSPDAALARLNAVMEPRFRGLAQSPLPVLLPFDTATLLRDQIAGSASETGERYLAGFHARSFFYAGPAGYDAAFGIRSTDVPELAGLRLADPIDVHITGSALVYQLEPAPPIAGTPAPEFEADFSGIRRILHEDYVRYAFVRYGAPYVVSIHCGSGGLTCQAADRIAGRFLRALRIAGGAPQPPRAIEPVAVERPKDASATFTYHSPGRLIPGTGVRNFDGRQDRTVYSQIRFPIADAPAFANSQLYPDRTRPAGSDPNYSYPWRDNFCEGRWFPVGQCPAGFGHQGQDIRPALCAPQPCPLHHDLVAVRDGAILRMPNQEAAYLVVNTASEHIRFRYLHMNPQKMNTDNLLNGRLVREGEVIGQVSDYSRREGGTSYHLHFDIQVPTADGWVFINPYMTLVAAYERLIGARGSEIEAPTPAASNAAPTPAPVIRRPVYVPYYYRGRRYWMTRR